MRRKEQEQKRTRNYTPPPWSVQPLQATEGADIAICSKNYVVAQVNHDPDIQRDPHEEPDFYNVVWHPSDKPNAALIGASPLLLEALQDMYAWGVKLNWADGPGTPMAAAALAIQTALDVEALEKNGPWGTIHAE